MKLCKRQQKNKNVIKSGSAGLAALDVFAVSNCFSFYISGFKVNVDNICYFAFMKTSIFWYYNIMTSYTLVVCWSERQNFKREDIRGEKAGLGENIEFIQSCFRKPTEREVNPFFCWQFWWLGFCRKIFVWCLSICSHCIKGVSLE